MSAPANNYFDNYVQLENESGTVSGTTVDTIPYLFNTGKITGSYVYGQAKTNGHDVWYGLRAGWLTSYAGNNEVGAQLRYEFYTKDANFKHKIRVYNKKAGAIKYIESKYNGFDGRGYNQSCEFLINVGNFITPISGSPPIGNLYVQVDSYDSGSADQTGSFTLCWSRSNVSALADRNKMVAFSDPINSYSTYIGSVVFTDAMVKSGSIKWFEKTNQSGSPTPVPTSTPKGRYFITYGGGAYGMNGEPGYGPNGNFGLPIFNTRCELIYNATGSYYSWTSQSMSTSSWDTGERKSEIIQDYGSGNKLTSELFSQFVSNGFNHDTGSVGIKFQEYYNLAPPGNWWYGPATLPWWYAQQASGSDFRLVDNIVTDTPLTLHLFRHFYNDISKIKFKYYQPYADSGSIASGSWVFAFEPTDDRAYPIYVDSSLTSSLITSTSGNKNTLMTPNANVSIQHSYTNANVVNGFVTMSFSTDAATGSLKREIYINRTPILTNLGVSAAPNQMAIALRK